MKLIRSNLGVCYMHALLTLFLCRFFLLAFWTFLDSAVHGSPNKEEHLGCLQRTRCNLQWAKRGLQKDGTWRLPPEAFCFFRSYQVDLEIEFKFQIRVHSGDLTLIRWIIHTSQLTSLLVLILHFFVCLKKRRFFEPLARQGGSVIQSPCQWLLC